MGIIGEEDMLALIIGLCLSLIGNTGTVHFDGDIENGLFDYAIVRVYSCDSNPAELIWTSGHLTGGDHYDYLAYFDLDDARDNEPYRVTCTLYIANAEGFDRQGGHMIVLEDYEVEDFTEIPQGSSNYYCTCDF